MNTWLFFFPLVVFADAVEDHKYEENIDLVVYNVCLNSSIGLAIDSLQSFLPEVCTIMFT